MNLALFDLDNTLLAGDSDFEWAQFLIAKGVLDREVHEAKNQAFYDDYKAGTLDIHAFLEFQLAPLARHARSRTRRLAPRIHGNAHPAGDRRRRHARWSSATWPPATSAPSSPQPTVSSPDRSAASSAFPTSSPPFPRMRMATSPARRAACRRSAKARSTRVEAWLESLGLWWGSFDQSSFYSDSLNDLPLLAKVSHPVAVDPDDTLRAHASQHGWPILSLR